MDQYAEHGYLFGGISQAFTGNISQFINFTTIDAATLPHNLRCGLCSNFYDNLNHIPIRISHDGTGCGHIFAKRCLLQWVDTRLKQAKHYPCCLGNSDGVLGSGDRERGRVVGPEQPTGTRRKRTEGQQAQPGPGGEEDGNASNRRILALPNRGRQTRNSAQSSAGHPPATQNTDAQAETRIEDAFFAELETRRTILTRALMEVSEAGDIMNMKDFDGNPLFSQNVLKTQWQALRAKNNITLAKMPKGPI